jgi:hypothetical protein
MCNLNNNDKNKNSVVTTTATTFLLLATTILVIAGVSAPFGVLAPWSAEGFIDSTTDDVVERPKGPVVESSKAPVVVSGDNIYIAWWTNNTQNGNEEVMFRASNDGGATFGDKINLSNTTNADSWRVEIAGEGADVVVSWWETNQTSDIPVARLSNDEGQTFGPAIMLGANGTISPNDIEAIAAEAGE